MQTKLVNVHMLACGRKKLCCPSIVPDENLFAVLHVVVAWQPILSRHGYVHPLTSLDFRRRDYDAQTVAQFVSVAIAKWLYNSLVGRKHLRDILTEGQIADVHYQNASCFPETVLISPESGSPNR
jgi:hypothetical protein